MHSCNPANPSTIFIAENCVRKDTACPLNIYVSCALCDNDSYERQGNILAKRVLVSNWYAERRHLRVSAQNFPGVWSVSSFYRSPNPLESSWL